MEPELNDELNSMMQSVSKNVGLYDLTQEPLYCSKSGQIFHITNRVDNKSHILKVIFKKSGEKQQSLIKKNFSRQKKIHESIKSRFVIQLLNAFSDETHYYMVLQYCEKHSLRTQMKKPLSIQTVKNYGLQLAKGISFLHKNKIIHNNLTPENVLLNKEDQIKICDFGESYKFQEAKNKSNMCGSFVYSPPQSVEKMNESKDIWAFGCILFEMTTGKVPFEVKSWKQLQIILREQYLLNYDFSVLPSLQLAHLLKHIFIYEQQKRLSIQQILNHPFFTGESIKPQVKAQKQHQNIKKKSSSKGKGVFRSLQLSHENKQNKNTNIQIKSTAPDYHKILQKKFKQESKQVSKQNSDHKHPSNPKMQGLSEELKGLKATKGTATTTHLNYNVLRNIFQSKKTEISPLKTGGMVIKEIDKGKNRIMIDQNGFTRFGVSDWMNISCDGKLIRFKKNGAEKRYALDQLPQKYYQKYQQSKRIVRQAMSCTPKITYKDPQLELNIMYDGRVIAKMADSSTISMKPEELLMNNQQIKQKDRSIIKNIYISLINIKKHH